MTFQRAFLRPLAQAGIYGADLFCILGLSGNGPALSPPSRRPQHGFQPQAGMAAPAPFNIMLVAPACVEHPPPRGAHGGAALERGP